MHQYVIVCWPGMRRLEPSHRAGGHAHLCRRDFQGATHRWTL